MPLAAPQTAAIVSTPRIFQDLAPAPRNPERDAMMDAAARRRRPPAGARRRGAAAAGGAAAGGAAAGGAAAGGAVAGGAAPVARRGGRAPARRPARGGGRGNAGAPDAARTSATTSRCIPTSGSAGGACGGLGLLLDIREATHPIRIDFVGDPNMSFWHSATFSNDGKKVLFSDEWGGGSAPRCRDTDKMEWGANALFAIENNKMVFKSYYKMPAAQTDHGELRRAQRIAHSDSGPRGDGAGVVPGRDLGVRLDRRRRSRSEIAFHDRGPLEHRTADRAAAPGRSTGTTACS